MPLSEEKKHEMLRSTADSAKALVEDISHIKYALAREQPDAGEIRRISAILRRLFVEGGINRVAAPRIGSFKVLAAPPALKEEDCADMEVAFFVNLGAVIGKGYKGPLTYIDTKGKADPLEKQEKSEFSIDTFLSQRTVCVNNTWISRRQLIKSIANKADGVHSEEPKEESDVALLLLRKCTGLTKSTEGVWIDQMLLEKKVPDEKFEKGADIGLDFGLCELLAICDALVKSPSLAALVEIINLE